MIKIKLLSVGKTRESWLEEGLREYVKRLSSLVQFEFIWLKDDQALEQACLKEKDVILLDPRGTSLDSPGFSQYLFQEIEKGGSRIVFAIGGADGFSDAIRKRFQRISFSPLTFTHQMSRLILLEQIFRAFEIRKGSAYHK